MSQAVDLTGTGLRLTLDLWHPNCWAIEATEQASGGILAHAIYDTPHTGGENQAGDQMVNGLFTAFGDSVDEVEELIDLVGESELTGEVLQLQERFGGRGSSNAPGNAAREFFLEYNPGDMICPTLVSHGFIHSAPVRIQGGREYWPVCFAGERAEVRGQLDAIEGTTGAEVEVARIASSGGNESERNRRLSSLTASQEEAFELARKRGYYQWPRGVSTRELADELDVSKTTLLEHLRKAEAKLLDP